jgi:hypothetical protein
MGPLGHENTPRRPTLVHRVDAFAWGVVASVAGAVAAAAAVVFGVVRLRQPEQGARIVALVPHVSVPASRSRAARRAWLSAP